MASAHSSGDIQAFRWVGGEAMFLDTVDVTACSRVVIGRYGGRTSAGADKNEDAALVWCAPDGGWELALLVDAHFSAESATLIVETVAGQASRIGAILTGSLREMPDALRSFFVALFGSQGFREQCRRVSGEASCLICVRRGQFLWWFSVGDCLLYLLHPELARFGQYTLNQRNFFEWIGQRNTFDLAVPCYSSGTRALPRGPSRVVLSTDGLFECGQPGAPGFSDPADVYRHFIADHGASLEPRVCAALERVHTLRGADSATVIAWSYDGQRAIW